MIVSYHTATEDARLTVEAALGVPRTDAWPDSLRNIVNDVVSLIRAGGLAGAAMPPERSSGVLESLDVSAGRLSAVLSGVTIDTRGLAVLRNVFAFADREVVEVRRLEFRWNRPLPEGWLSRAALPEGHAMPSFQLDVDLSRDVVDVELRHESGAEAADLFIARFGWWFSVVSAGGYDSDPKRPPDVPIALDDAPTVLPGLVHFPLVEVRCDDSAFDALINVVQRFHSEVAPVVALSIE